MNSKKINALIAAILILCTCFTQAQATNLKNFKIDSLYEGEQLIEIKLDELIADIQPGTIIVLSEYHATVDPQTKQLRYNEHQKKQLLFLNRLMALNPGTKINVGMEFVYYTYNNVLIDYLAGNLTDEEFMQQAAWGGNHFPSYKPLINFPKASGGVTRGINLPRSISSKILYGGVKSLSPDEAKLLPPNFQLGRDEYRDRIIQYTGGHFPPDQFENFFAAQSSWDDTMAYQTVEYMKNRPDEFFVIIVGDFHNIYGGGLPDRLKARGANLLVTISQESADQMTDTDMKSALGKDQNGEARADFLWISK